MIKTRVPPKRRRRKRVGNRRQIPLDERSCGWNARARTKVSAYAAKGFLYEVRLEHYKAWDDMDRPKLKPGQKGFGCAVTSRYDAILDQLRASTECRIVGRYGQFIENGYTKRNIRVYLRSDADLFFLRLILKDPFRVYRLVSPGAP